eukprot:1552224-Alexandrium_andersonii.AAC.1
MSAQAGPRGALAPPFLACRPKVPMLARWTSWSSRSVDATSVALGPWQGVSSNPVVASCGTLLPMPQRHPK